MLNCRGQESRDDAARYTSGGASRRGATATATADDPSRRDVVVALVVAGWKTRISVLGAHGRASYSFRKREPCISDVKRSTTNRRARREERSRLTVTYGHNSRILHKRLVERERERLGCLDGLSSLRSRLIPVYMTPGRGRARHGKGVAKRIDLAYLLVGDLSDIRVRASAALAVFAILSDYADDYGGEKEREKTHREKGIPLFSYSIIPIVLASEHRPRLI